MWVIFYYCIISFFTEPLFIILKNKVPSFYIYSAFTIVEYTLFTLFLYLSFKERVFKRILIIGSLVFYAVAFFNYESNNTKNFDSLPASVEALLMIIYVICFFYEQIKDPAIFYIYNSKKFWIVIAFFLYFSSTLFLFLYAATLTNQEHKNYWFINNMFNILKNVLFCIALLLKPKKKQATMENFYPDIL